MTTAPAPTTAKGSNSALDSLNKFGASVTGLQLVSIPFFGLAVEGEGEVGPEFFPIKSQQAERFRFAVRTISEIWGEPNGVARALHDHLQTSLPPSERPSLDRLLMQCGLLAAYEQANRPRFAGFREWWKEVCPEI
jgi:hypothetical protein